MILVGLSLPATAWARRPPLGVAVPVVAVLTVLFGVLSSRTARLPPLDAVEVPRR